MLDLSVSFLSRQPWCSAQSHARECLIKGVTYQKSAGWESVCDPPALQGPLVPAQVFLWPIALILIVLPFAVLTGFSPTRFTLNIYFG